MRSGPDLSSADETIVVALAKQGDAAAFEELVKRRQSWLRNVLRRLTGDTALADDLAQQAFLKAWLGIARLQHDEAFGGWLRRLAVNAWFDHLRRNDPLSPGDACAEELLESAADDEALPIAAGIDLDRALALLPPRVRLCIVLFYGEGMTHPEIAELTALPLGTVKSHIGRGLERLRKTLLTEDA